LHYLSEHHCDAIQGFYFSCPVSADAFEQLLRDGPLLRPCAGSNGTVDGAPSNPVLLAS